MPHISSYRHGVPNWVDVSSPDPAAAAAFYGALFGWDAPEQPADFGGYRLFLKDGKPVAGVGPLMQGPPSWTTYVNVDDIDAAAARVTEGGGTVVVPPMDLPGASGRIGFGIDPAGGFVGLFQAGPNNVGAELVNELGTLVWNELNVRDPLSVLPFYEHVFGWEFVVMEGTPSGYHVVTVRGRAVAGVAAVLTAYPPAFYTVQWLGAAYLAYLGVRMLLAKPGDVGVCMQGERPALCVCGGVNWHMPARDGLATLSFEQVLGAWSCEGS